MRKKINNFSGRNFLKKREDDKLSKKKRSNLMSQIRSKDTKFELGFISELKKQTKIKFKTNVSSLRGKPDIVFLKQKVCVFLDSDFWHGWQYPRWKHLLKDDFWRNKIQANRNRDCRVARYLKSHGWVVLRFWEHELNSGPNLAITTIFRCIKNG